jgi:hypothetical protein
MQVKIHFFEGFDALGISRIQMNRRKFSNLSGGVEKGRIVEDCRGIGEISNTDDLSGRLAVVAILDEEGCFLF